MKGKEELQADLDTVLSKIARLEPHETPGLEQHFHLGMVGGSGHNVAKLNERRMDALERTIDRSVELAPLYRERDRLEKAITFFDERQERAKKAQEMRAAAQERLRNVKPGQEVILRMGNIVTVRRVNQKSITTTGGSKWSYDELVDVVQSEQE